MVIILKKLKNASYYIILLILGIFVALLYNIYSNKNITNKQTNTITRMSENSGIKYSILSNYNNEKLEKLNVTYNSVKFILNIYNFDNFEKKNNIITIFINNIQVNFDFNNKKNNKNYAFNLKAKNNSFKLKINNLNLTNKENNLLIMISKKGSNYNIMDSYEEQKSNSTNFINLKLFNYNIKNTNNIKTEYKHYDYEKDIKINTGIYLNQSLNDSKINIIPFIKSKTNKKIYIPVIIKNDNKYVEANIICLVNNQQYKLYNQNYISLKLNNSLAKFMYFCIESPNQKENYKINVILRCKNKDIQQNYLSNTINLIVE